MSWLYGEFQVRREAYSLKAELRAPKQGITAIFGHSGAGKSTLLRSIAGLEKGIAQKLVVGGAVWEDRQNKVFVPPHLRPIAYVFQEVGLFTHMNVLRNIEYGMKRVPAAQRKIALADAVDLLGIAHLMARRPDTLSGGEKQRVGIARALASSPQLLLLDEPFSGLDLARKREVMPYLEKLHQQLGIPMLYVSHDVDEISQLADHLVLLEDGCVLASGKTAEILSRLDLPLAQGDVASSIIQGKVAAFDAKYDLITVDFGDGFLTLPGAAGQLGQSVRLRMQARDVSVSLKKPEESSVLNTFGGILVDMRADSLGQMMLAIDVGRTRMLCRITRRSAAQLDLQIGQSLFAHVKGVAMLG